MQELLNYKLPNELIAKYPEKNCTDAKLLHIEKEGKNLHKKKISDLIDILQPGDCLVINDTKVLKAQFNGNKITGGKVHCQIDKIINKFEAIVFLKSSKAPKKHDSVKFNENISLIVQEQHHTRFLVKFNKPITDIMQTIGTMPIPPYLKRAAEEIDNSRYQTCFAKNPGAVAAPTAGLHFNQDLLTKLEKKNVNIAKITLHVGAGTFEPITENQIKSGKLHAEKVIISQETCDIWYETRKTNKKIIAVGSTCLRALESAFYKDRIQPFNQETDILIQPGYKFKAADALMTNFHLPGSSLLLLVAAFNGIDNTQTAYDIAIKQNFRFFSYGDAMLIY